MLQLPPRCKVFILVLHFKRHEVVAGALGGADDLVQFDLHGLSVPVSRRVDQEHHQEGQNSGAGIEDKEPVFVVAEIRTARCPNHNSKCGKYESHRP